MVTFTTNKGLALPSSLVDTGTWGPLVNQNGSFLDSMMGGTTTLSISTMAATVTLSASSYNNFNFIVTGFNGGDMTFVMPSVGSFYTFFNATSNSSAFNLIVKTSVGGVEQVAIPPNVTTNVFSDFSGNMRFMSLPPVGAIVDFATTTIPAWIFGCTKTPYLYCNGGTFSSASYPYLRDLLGGTTLPDFRGRMRAYFNDGTGRITSAGGGVNGDVILSAGGSQTRTLSSLNIPLTPYSDPGHFHFTQGDGGGGAGSGLLGINARLPNFGGKNSNPSGIGITIGNVAPAAFTNIYPIQIAGITMIRSG